MRSSETAVWQATAKDKYYKVSDPEGPYLIMPDPAAGCGGSTSLCGAERRLILDAYPDVSLKEVATVRLMRESCLRRASALGAQLVRTSRRSLDAGICERCNLELEKKRHFHGIGALLITELDEPIVLSVLRKIEKQRARSASKFACSRRLTQAKPRQTGLPLSPLILTAHPLLDINNQRASTEMQPTERSACVHLAGGLFEIVAVGFQMGFELEGAKSRLH